METCHATAQNFIYQQDNTDAQKFIVVMYCQGKRVSRNIIIAKERYLKACDKEEQKGCDSYKILNDRGY